MSCTSRTYSGWSINHFTQTYNMLTLSYALPMFYYPVFPRGASPHLGVPPTAMAVPPTVGGLGSRTSHPTLAQGWLGLSHKGSWGRMEEGRARLLCLSLSFLPLPISLSWLIPHKVSHCPKDVCVHQGPGTCLQSQCQIQQVLFCMNAEFS